MRAEGWLGRATRKVTAHAVEKGLQRLADAARTRDPLPLVIVLPNGEQVHFGAPPKITLTIRDEAALAALAQPTMAALGEAFVEGRVDLDGPMLEAVALAERLAALGGSPVGARVAGVFSRHTPKQDREAIAYHYDVGNEFYRLWLDERMVYSCAYFRTGEESIDEAQLAKLDHICRKLRLAPGERFLDIGCGWGGLIIHAAQKYGVRAIGITLSEAQQRLAAERIAAAGLGERCQALLLDYREAVKRFGAESFDKVASVGMFEHVGLRNLGTYFGIVRELLRERGLFLNHGITSADVDSRPVGSGVGDFIGTYVFPHGELPHVSLALREMAAQGFEVVDVESLRPHYAKTLQHWSNRLEARLPEARRLVDEKTLRIWRAYLAGCSYGFTRHWINIYQLLGSKQTQPGLTELPLTRDWMYAPA